MSIRPRCTRSSFSIFFARRISPAHVPKVGRPSEITFLISSNKSRSWRSFPIAVLSPPGIISPLILLFEIALVKSDFFLISNVSTPIFSSILSCSIKAPCRARTPIFIIYLFQPLITEFHFH